MADLESFRAELRAWLGGAQNPTATLTSVDIQTDPEFGDRMSYFSSRGPDASVPDVIKPDVTAPGVAIFAAWMTPGALPASSQPEYNVIQGTSMSSPHAAGAAALVRALHPDWTPAQVQSALMTTAFQSPDGGKEVQPVVKEDHLTPADPFDIGAGRVDLTRAGRAALLFNETAAGYLGIWSLLGLAVVMLALQPWREVVNPHPDVASGRYLQAEFAADLWQVHLGEGTPEYRDPAEFFRRTYLTESLKRLLVTGANAGANGTCAPADCKTNSSGQVTFTYTGTAPGDDTTSLVRSPITIRRFMTVYPPLFVSRAMKFPILNPIPKLGFTNAPLTADLERRQPAVANQSLNRARRDM